MQRSDPPGVSRRSPFPAGGTAEAGDPSRPGDGANLFCDESGPSDGSGLLAWLQRAALIVAAVLGIAALLLVANTIRLAAFARRKEIAIMRLVGASNFYIQLPFLLEGMIAGLIGWAIAAGLLVAVKSLMLDSLGQYFSFNVGLSVGDLIEVILVSMAVGVLLCGVTSFLTLRRYLRI